MNPGNFLTELKRRNVNKVPIAYAVVAWLLIQVAILERLREASKQRCVTPYIFALIYLGLGEKDEAMHFL